MEFNVIYQAFSGIKTMTIVSVHGETTSEDGLNTPMFYAKNLSVFGCGKKSTTPKGAVQKLVMDHSQFIYTITEV